MQTSAPSMSQQVGLQSAMAIPKDASHESNLSTAQRSETIASVQDNNGHERLRKASLVSRVKSAVKNRENVKLAACYYALATAGWNDASLGPLIPYMETYFGIGYTIVSTMFIASCMGYIVAGVTNNRVTDKFGMGRVITAGAMLQTIAYAVVIAPPPFAVLPIAWTVVGLGVAFQDAQANAWVAGLPNAHIKLGYLHGAYGLGALASPLVATAFVEAGIKFSFFFSVSLAIAATDVLVLFLCFWRDREPMDHEEQRPTLKVSETMSGAETPNATPAIELKEMSTTSPQVDESELVTGGPSGAPALAGAVGRDGPDEEPDNVAHVARTTSAKDKEIFTNRHVWFTAAFLFLYVGAEVSIGGWIVTFLIDERDGNSTAGYVASGFWGGIALGRLVLPRFNNWFGERNVVFLYILLALGLEMVIWFAHQLIANAVAVSLVGFILGPFFPIAISVIGKLLPRYLHTGAIGLIAAIGSAGAAIFPFCTGAIAQRYGAWVLQPVIVSLLVGMGLLWLNVPAPPQERKRR